MKAMILAAGLGTRLRPLTDEVPKALVPFKGVPMLEGVVRNLASAGIDHIIVNVHHHAQQVIDFLDQLEIQGVSFSVSDESDLLMDTGGAILHARDLLDGEKEFLVHNVDVVTNLDLQSLIRKHQEGNALVTIAVKKRQTSRSLLFDGDGFLSGWRHNETGEERMVRTSGEGIENYGNSCVQVINSEFLSFFKETKPMNLTNMYLELAGNHRIQPFVHNDDYWYDLGRYGNFLKADKEVF